MNAGRGTSRKLPCTVHKLGIYEDTNMIQLLINVRVLLFIAVVALMSGCGGGGGGGGSTNTDCVLGTSTLDCTLN